MSGQNVLLLCMLVLAVCAVLDVPLRARLAVAAVLVAMYVPLAGGGPSIQRAGVMGIAGLVAALAGRPASRWYALGLAAAVTLALNPLAAGEPGLAALVRRGRGPAGARAAAARRARAPRVPEPVADVAAITVAATLATAPLMALHFEQVSLASLPANLLAAPVVAPVMWLGMLGMARRAGRAGARRAAQRALRAAAGLPGVGGARRRGRAARGRRRCGCGGPAGLAVALRRRRCRGWRWSGGAAGAAARRGWMPRRVGARRRLRAARIGAARRRDGAGGPSSPARRGRRRRAPGELVVSFLDVGQGDAMLLQRDATSVLVDTGPPGGPILRRLAEAGVEPARRARAHPRRGRPRGHGAPGHRRAPAAAGARRRRGLADRRAARAARGARPRAAAARSPPTPARCCASAALRLRVLWPPAPRAGWRPEGNPNDRAVVAHVQDGAFDLLLPADAESNVTAALDLPRVEALKVAHHGSADEGLPGDARAHRAGRSPRSRSGRNSYGHPAPSTLGALRAVPQLVPHGPRRDRAAAGGGRADAPGGGRDRGRI